MATHVEYKKQQVAMDVAVEMMDDVIRERLHDEIAPCTDQEFFDAYVEAHLKKFGEEFLFNP